MENRFAPGRPGPDAAPASDPGALDRELARTGIGMTLFQRLSLRRESGALTRAAMSEVVTAVVAEQRDELRHRLMLRLDIKKKTAFRDYMDLSGVLDGQIVDVSSRIERDLRDRLFEEVTRVMDEEDALRRRFLDRADTPGRRAAIEARIERHMRLAEEQIEAKIDLALRTHSAVLQATFKLLEERVPDP